MDVPKGISVEVDSFNKVRGQPWYVKLNKYLILGQKEYIFKLLA
jgi:hypothetical protein